MAKGFKGSDLFRREDFTKKGHPFLAFDPSLRSAGWATFSDGDPKPKETGIFVADKEDDFREAGLEYAWKIENLLRENPKLEAVFCEWPAFHDATVATTGALVKLSWSVGIVAGVAAMVGVPFYPVTVVEWKGQLKKKVVNQRIERILGKKNCQGFKRDIWDAVGIGLYVLGKF